MKKGDLWLIAVIALVSLSGILIIALSKLSNETSQGPTYAKIMLDGELYQEVELKDNDELIEISTF